MIRDICFALLHSKVSPQFELRPEKNITGPNGHGPVDFAIDLLQTAKILGVTEVWSKVRFWEFGNQKTRNDLLSFLDCHVLDARLILGSRRNFEGCKVATITTYIQHFCCNYNTIL
ncbi:unnamed protein product [Rhizophagus irregularis]|nr:unnamed protein product [Rhizophagus irregularis]